MYQVRHEASGQRLCFLKILSGTLQVKESLTIGDTEHKINEIRQYHGEKYTSVPKAFAGDLVAIPGLPGLKAGDGIHLPASHTPHQLPMMAADVFYNPKEIPPFKLLEALRQLEEEEPTLSLSAMGERITVSFMGKIQLDVLRQQLQERFALFVTFGPARVIYRETIAAPVIGIGHYEPLRHYAECHLRLVPTPPGSGITFRSLCHVDDLALNWQRLIETHVFEKPHKGVLTGAPLTDVRIELLCGRAHLKHTEGGDFRQAVYRGIRQGLMQARSLLLEPICGFRIRGPQALYGTLSGALTRLKATVTTTDITGDTLLLAGEAPWALFAPWQEDFLMLTHGQGSLQVWTARYAPCTNQAEVVAAAGYTPLADDTPDSVFCSHGAGYVVPWQEVPAHAHLDSSAIQEEPHD